MKYVSRKLMCVGLGLVAIAWESKLGLMIKLIVPEIENKCRKTVCKLNA